MSRQRPYRKKPQAAGRAAADGKGKAKPSSEESSKSGRWPPSASMIRETVESVVIAFVLAFLFRTFEAEAFVIPTGSMAPTLMGRHKDLICEECGYPYRVSASDEVDQTTSAKIVGKDVYCCTCPMCRFTMEVSPDAQKSYKGDRILVGKFAYQFSDPERWDVAVFKFPGGAKTNYIKRLVGLPNETIRLTHGDVYYQPEGADDFYIARKPPEKILAMLQIVFDNDYMPAITRLGWSERWKASYPTDPSAGGWYTEDDRCFTTNGTAASKAWVRYNHIVPPVRRRLEKGNIDYADPKRERQELISDFCAYNYSHTPDSRQPLLLRADPRARGVHWVGDLAVQCTLTVESGKGAAIFELVEGGRAMRCKIDLASGQASLSISTEAFYGQMEALAEDGKPFNPTAQTDVRLPGEYEILFANVDDQLVLWVDGDPVTFKGTTKYQRLREADTTGALIDGNTVPKHSEDNPDLPSDLAPVGIGSDGARLTVSHLKVFRDIYYIAQNSNGGALFRDFGYTYGNPHGAVDDVLSNRDKWKTAFRDYKQVEFPLDADQFLALGDNSAKSKDSRLWGESEHYVSRDLLIGKALYIYWPHSWDRVNVFGKEIPFPFFPNFARMGFVR